MPRFMFIYHLEKRSDDPEEKARLLKKWDAWIENLGDAMVHPGTALGKSRTLRANDASEDGRAISMIGYSLLEAPHMDAALKVARGCPHLEIGSIDVAEMADG